MLRRLLFLLVIIPVFAIAQVSQLRLSNGLQIIVKTDTRAPVVLSTLWYRVGGSYEHNGITGISHILEHMMFQGTQQTPAGEFVRLIASTGGQLNAVTSSDYTEYYEYLSKQYLPLALRLEADRMHNLIIDQARFQRELNVVKEERHMRLDDNPFAFTWERLNALAFVNNPYHHPTVGWPSDLNSMTMRDAASWYQKWYAPNNAILVVVGDVTAKTVFALATKYFGAIPAHQLPIIKPRIEVSSVGEKQLDVSLPGKSRILFMAYKTPSLVTLMPSQRWQAYALGVMSAILGQGATSRFSDHLIRGARIATAANSHYNLVNLHSGLFTISVIPAKKISFARIQNAVNAQINNMKAKPVTQEELKRIKAAVISTKVYALDSLTAQANDLGRYAVVGLPLALTDNFVKNVESVTPKQIQIVAKKYFKKNNLSIARFTPTKE